MCFMFTMNIKHFIKIGFVLLIVSSATSVIEFVNIKYIIIKLYPLYNNFIFFKIGCLNMNSVNWIFTPTDEKPYWFDVQGLVEEYTELATHAFQSLADAGTAWVNEVIPKEEDGVLKITNGKMTTVCTCKTKFNLWSL